MRTKAEKEQQPKTDDQAPASLQRDGKTATGRHAPATPPVVNEVLASPGQRLNDETRAFMEPRFSFDFSKVRVHTGEKAAESAEQVDARAYTVGSDVVFGAGEYEPGTERGQQLLAHELVHVVQQQSAGAAASEEMSVPGDSSEQAADRAVAEVDAGRLPSVQTPGAHPGLQRATAQGGSPLLSAPLIPKSQGRLVVESFLNQMWDKQSAQQKPFRVTSGVFEGLNMIFTFGAPVMLMSTFPTTAELIKRLGPSIPQTVNPHVEPVLDQLTNKEPPLLAGAKTPSGDAAAPSFPVPGPSPAAAGPDPRKPPASGEAANKAEMEEAAKAALEQAFDQFSKTKLGKELGEAVKSYVLSKEGIPLVVLVVGGALTFIAANDPKIPSVPEIPLGDGIKLKVDYTGRPSDLPPLLRQLVKGQSDPRPAPGKEEIKIGLTVTMTFEAMGELASAVGSFFAKAGKFIADGLVTVGTVIGRAVSSYPHELISMLFGGAVGAIFGGLFGGPVGAIVGGLIGAGAALIATLIDRPNRLRRERGN